MSGNGETHKVLTLWVCFLKSLFDFTDPVNVHQSRTMLPSRFSPCL